MIFSIWFLVLTLFPFIKCETSQDEGESYPELEKFVGEVVNKLDDEEELNAEDEEGGDSPLWMVQSTDQIGFCLLASAEIKLELVKKNDENNTIKVDIPLDAEVTGVCKPEKAELRFEWKDRRIGEEKNLLNLVVEKHHANLAHLDGAFVRLKTKHGREEFYSAMETDAYTTLLWPIRYLVSCTQTLSYRMAPAAEETRRYSEVVLHLTGLRVEAFRESTLHDHVPESMGPKWYRREWGCEFHRTFDWAPFLVAGGLATLVLVWAVAFLWRNSVEKKQKLNKKYDRL